ncbi:MAG: preprotein translocase subunit SecG [Bacteroidetes bacterium]|nr:MAG: preprotein translocase subunit SecG [Bacteroidota bacterium]
METIFTILLILVCILLILVVLMQNSKGGGIASEFSTANQIIGVTRGADFIEKTTWTLAGIMLALSLLLAPKVNTSNVPTENTESATRKKAAGAVIPQTPVTPTQQNNNRQPTK